MPESPLRKFRVLVQSWLGQQQYGSIIRPNMWDGYDPQDELCHILTTRDLFSQFIDTKRLEAILVDDADIRPQQLAERVRQIVRPSRRGFPQETKLVSKNVEMVKTALI